MISDHFVVVICRHDFVEMGRASLIALLLPSRHWLCYHPGMDTTPNKTPPDSAAPGTGTPPTAPPASAAENTVPAQAEQPKQPRRQHLVLWTLVLVFVIYPLSSGPLVKLWATAGFSPDPMLGLYTPLIYLAFYIPVVRSVLGWYLKLWGAELW